MAGWKILLICIFFCEYVMSLVYKFFIENMKITRIIFTMEKIGMGHRIFLQCKHNYSY